MEEVAAYLKVNKDHTWRLTRPVLAKGEPIPTLKFGGAIRVRRSELDAWLERRNVVDR